MLEGTPFKAVGHGGQRFAVDALLLQRQTVSILVIVPHKRDLRQSMLHQPAVKCFDERIGVRLLAAGICK